ncbi:MAG: hypothetical protein AAGD32_14345, partial [Planctomycetota bacterium]
MQKFLIAAASAVVVSSAHAQFADSVVEFIPGSNVGAFDDPSSALGEPSRLTDSGGATTPFFAAADPSRLVTVGEGGSLTIAFASPVVDNPASVQFGIDFLVFGNAFFFDDFSSPQGTPEDPVATGVFAEGGSVEVSADGVNFFPLSGVADGSFPTLGFTDPDPVLDIGFDGLDLPVGTTPTDFTIAVDPSLDPIGLSASELIAAYDGSGGGAGFDFSSTGLSSIQFVRITNPVGSGVTPEIDGFADVIPE